MSGTEQSAISSTTETGDESHQDNLIRIRASSKRNSLTSLIVGCIGAFVSVLLFKLLPENFFLVGIFAASLAIVALLIGILKLREPPFSFEISKEDIRYLHRHGKWAVQWDNIQRIDVPKVHKGLEHEPLAMIGIRIKDYRPLLDDISPRLISNILMEQRPLLLHGRDDCATGTCYGDDLIEDDKYKFEDGTVIKGMQAMLANRMTKLRNNLGYDLFVAVGELDRPTDEFVTLLRECKESVERVAIEASE